jgi:O-antigen ligase
MRIAVERPLTGVGAGAFMIAWPDFAPGDAGPPRTAHNTFVQLVSELGFPGLSLFVAAFVAGLIGVRQAVRAPGIAPFARGVQGGLAGFGVCSISTGLAFSWPLYLLLGLAVAAQREGANRRKNWFNHSTNWLNHSSERKVHA